MSNRNFDGFASVEAREEYLEHNMAPQPSSADEIVTFDQGAIELRLVAAASRGTRHQTLMERFGGMLDTINTTPAAA